MSEQLTNVQLTILGGGQLGRMLVEAAVSLGISPRRIHLLDPSGSSAAAAGLVPESNMTKVNLLDAKLPFPPTQAGCKHVVTVEIEHVSVEALKSLVSSRSDVTVQPKPQTIEIIQDKYLQKEHFRKAGIVLPEYEAADSFEALHQIGEKYGYPLMLKSRCLAYDGRGNAVARTREDLQTAWDSLKDKGGIYVEKWVPFTKELAVMVARSATGEVVSYPTVESFQKESQCHVVVCPAQIDPRVGEVARQLAEKAVASLDGAGMFGVELFLLSDGSILLNEVAPRVHNTGHFTIEACETSQFEQHIRCVLGMPLGGTKLKVGASVMVNVLGTGNLQETFEPCARSLSIPGASLHWYDKGEPKSKRKMGHITFVDTSMQQVWSKVQAAFATIDHEVPVAKHMQPIVGVIMGSDSDLPVMKTAATILAKDFKVPIEVQIVSAHRTPERMVEYAKTAHLRGLKVIIAAAGGAAHLPGMVAALTPLPVIGVPISLAKLDGVDSLHSIVQMPRGVPVATVAIDNSTNAALLAIRILGCQYPELQEAMLSYQTKIRDEVYAKVDRMDKVGWETY